MLVASSVNGYTNIFTASFPSIYSFVFCSPEVNHSFVVALVNGGYLRVKMASQLNESQMVFSLYLGSQDIIQYKGAGGDLYGVRVGSDL